MVSLSSISSPHSLVTDSELAFILGGSPDSRYGKVKRLLAQGKLLHIRRGLYGVVGELSAKTLLHPFAVAQHIYAPSYVSLESALSYHRLIPESVHEITSVTTKRSKEFCTALGKFSYAHLPMENFYLSVELVTMDGHQFFMAKPWKAICDYVYCYKKDWCSVEPLLNSLRIDIEELPIFSDAEMAAFEDYYHSKRIICFLNGIKK